ncbi:SMI1/KNR4 family protein [Nocardioides mangrovicus]|uniref:SMI1/KNR4 family protein n=1 Tax=Nocardioides mangrovicus TaxID=2478913 RepID=A0A3L8NZ04_9ACTN|nr:SMI1/KNR4 family protein [Nocardioides mangrovicus]RLV47882.1 SMI1/KNR4 family protein [Nocardioides mangrovicus]
MADLDRFETWRPVLAALRATAPSATSLSWSGTATASSMGGNAVADGARADLGRDVMDAVTALAQRLAPDRELVIEAAITGTDARVRCSVLPPEVEASFVVVDAVTLRPGTMPRPFRSEPDRSLDRPASPGQDPAFVDATVRRALPDAAAHTLEEIAEFERVHAVTLPDDVRSLYLAANEGDLKVGDEDAPVFALELLPIGNPSALADYSASARFFGWALNGTDVARVDPGGRVQALAGVDASTWLPLGTDGGGNLFVVDLAPGPHGWTGQILFVDHEESLGATRIAESLTALLRGDVVDEPRAEPDRATASTHQNPQRTPDQLVGPATQVLQLFEVTSPVDLAPLAGHPALRAVSAEDGSIADLAALRELPALELLRLSVRDWTTLLDDGPLPPQLHAALILDDPGPARLDLVDRLLSLSGQPPLHWHEATGELPPPVLPPASPRERRRWWQRRG